MPSDNVYCMLSGIASTGPLSFFPCDDEELEAIVNGLVQRLVDTGRTDLPPVDELTTILNDSVDDPSFGFKGHGWEDDTVAVFGPAHRDKENPTYLRFCKDGGGFAGFEQMLDPSGKWIDHRIDIWESDYGDQDCAFMFRRCWFYLRSWLDVFPPGVKDGIPFAKALWDVVEPSLGQGWPADSILPELDYGDMLFIWARDGQKYWGGWENYDCGTKEDRVTQVLEGHCSADVPNLAEAISKGLRGENLLPALHRDMGTWMFEDPDMWPPRVQTSAYILFEILPNLALIDVLHVSAICKSMRNLLLREDVITTLIRKMIHCGSLRWIKPCAEDLLSWMEPEDAPNQIIDPLIDAKFPFIRFVHACLHKSDSMKSRKRLWDIAKQLEGKWNP
ncbi:hypothetical protein DL96DRAFT_1589183 [Flagelloscypha sp. PMI_526]|nr:hypothetical protein DL96DRAFT_1589183 [Flagelloscypha sp. PMI_526]